MKTIRLDELDGLRGIAALAIATFHYLFQYDHVYGHIFSVPAWAKLGYFGVHLFFLVSGFVIFWTISKVERPFDFIWSRASRLYPVYWAAATLTFVVISIFGLAGREVSAIDLLLNYSMIHEYFGIKHVDGVYWSLTLEITFYAWMLILFFFNQIKNIEKWLFGWIILAALISNDKFGFDLPTRVKYLFLLDYIALFSAGICFYLIKSGRAKLTTYGVLAASTLSLFVQHPLNVAMILCVIYSIFYLAISGRLTFLAIKPLVFMGTISYSFYLIHQNIGYLIINKFYAHELSPIVGIATAFLVAFLLATFLTFTIEKPTMSYLRNYYKDSTRIQQFANKLSFFGSR